MRGEKHIILGGNGFVGTRIAKLLVQRGETPICISRSGTMPVHLQDQSWADSALWISSEDSTLVAQSFREAKTLFCLVGSPPIPTTSHASYLAQVAQNSQPNLTAIEQATATNIEQVVLLGAHLPSLINREGFGYAKGKRLCFDAAQSFAESAPNRGAAVLQPTAIYGTRHTKNGRPIRLRLLMGPVSRLQGCLPNKLKESLPEQLVSVDAVAQAAVHAALDEKYFGRFSVFPNSRIISINEMQAYPS